MDCNQSHRQTEQLEGAALRMCAQMNLETAAESIAKQIGRRYLNLTLESRAEIASLIVSKIQPLVTEQRKLNFSDHEKRVSPQCGKILALLKEKGSAGVTNAELVTIGFNYRARISELRLQHNYKIDCEDLRGGLTRYRLHPSDWT